MKDIISGCLDKFVFAYLDNFLMYSKIYEAHIDQVKQFCLPTDEKSSTQNIQSAVFVAHPLNISDTIYQVPEIKSSQKKLEPHTIGPPQTKKEAQSCFSLVNYIRRFIRSCSVIAEPLIELTKNCSF